MYSFWYASKASNFTKGEQMLAFMETNVWETYRKWFGLFWLLFSRKYKIKLI